MKSLSLTVALLLGAFSMPVLSADLPRTPSPEGAEVYIISPADGAVVKNPITVKFGLKGMGVAPAGADIANTGHHHLMINGKMLPATNKPMGQEVTHFGGGQTETVITLDKGQHTLQLIMGDKYHIPHDPPVISEKITITVK